MFCKVFETTNMAEKNIAAHKFSDKILDSIPCEQWFLQGRNHCSQGIDSIASHADVLRGSSRVPAPRTGAGTRDKPIRTSAWEANRTSRLFHTSCYKPCPSYENSHFVNYTKGKTFVVKMSFICMRTNSCFNTSIALHLASL